MERIVALDVGDKRIGIAVSDMLGITAQPVRTLTRAGYGPDTQAIVAIAQEYGAADVLCGLPRHMDGTEGEQAQKVRAFADQLAALGLRIHFWDERMTTMTATRTLIAGGVRRADRKAFVDKVAAVVILQGFLDAGGLRRLRQE